MLDEYYDLRGWDQNGIPTEKKLKELGLNDVAEDFKKMGKIEGLMFCKKSSLRWKPESGNL